jgi:glycosyltransferase involved in cell wall biosynthesis
LLREKDKSIYLLLSGKVDKNINIKLPFIIYEKLPKREQLVLGLNASDVLIIASSDNPFTRYCFPQKLFEYMAVNIPIVATAVGDVVRILQSFKGSLCKPGSTEDLKDKISVQLKKKHINYRRAAMSYTWEKLSKKLDNLIEKSL